MIFITLGSQKFQFNRLLKWIDELIEENKINEKVFAQTGWSTYQPTYFESSDFLNREEFIKTMTECSVVLTHGGTGAIVTALKNEKKVIAVPRLYKYDEHVDNHQTEIIQNFEKMNLIFCANEKNQLIQKLIDIEDWKFSMFNSNNLTYIDFLSAFIENL